MLDIDEALEDASFVVEWGTVRPTTNKPRIRAMRNVMSGQVSYKLKSGRMVDATPHTTASFRKDS